MVKNARIPQHIIDAAMGLAAERGWQAVTLADVALRAELPLAEVYSHFHSRDDILRGLMAQIDERMLQGDLEPEASVRDRLFDVTMRRLEALVPYRPALRAILNDGGGGGPLGLVSGACRFSRSMALLLEASGVSSGGLGGLARVGGMAAIYLSVMRVWLEDDTADMSRTMAALDKALRRADGLACRMWRRSGPATPPPSGEAPQEA